MSTADPESKPDCLTPEQAGLVRSHLKEILASNAFVGSKRAQDFLQLIVEHALAGRYDHLRERMIGAEMFGRPVNYDTANDAVVRVKATEVRKKLAQYYQELTRPAALRIELPPGSYVPQFHWEAPEKAAPAGSESHVAAPPQPFPAQQPAKENAQPPAKTGRRNPRVLAASIAAVALIAVLVYLGMKIWSQNHGAGSDVHSIAILPLENLSGDPRQEYFADGLTDELIADLGQVSALRVISRTSSMTYKNTKKTLPEIAHELGVDAIVEGSVLREGDQVRVTAQLIDARTDEHIWAHTYVRDLTSVLALQGEVAQAVADQVKIEITPQEQARLARKRPIDTEAQDLYLLGAHFLNTGDPRQAIGYLQEATDKAPNYAPAHAALADAYNWLGDAGWMPYIEAFPRAKAEAAKAVEIDDALPAGHAELARAVISLNWDWPTAEREFQRALELNPNSAAVHGQYGFYLERHGQIQEGLAQVNRELELDPVSSSAYYHAGFADYYARRYDAALANIQRSAALEPNPPVLLFPTGVIYAELGKYREAIAQFQQLGDQPHALGHMGNAYARMGQPAEARALIAKLEDHVQKTGIGRYEIAIVYAGLGDKDDAFAWLDKAFDAHDKGLTYLKIDPCVDPLRSDPRFADLLQRVGLPR
jgi:TolB-like protein